MTRAVLRRLKLGFLVPIFFFFFNGNAILHSGVASRAPLVSIRKMGGERTREGKREGERKRKDEGEGKEKAEEEMGKVEGVGSEKGQEVREEKEILIVPPECPQLSKPHPTRFACASCLVISTVRFHHGRVRDS